MMEESNAYPSANLGYRLMASNQLSWSSTIPNSGQKKTGGPFVTGCEGYGRSHPSNPAYQIDLHECKILNASFKLPPHSRETIIHVELDPRCITERNNVFGEDDQRPPIPQGTLLPTRDNYAQESWARSTTQHSRKNCGDDAMPWTILPRNRTRHSHRFESFQRNRLA